MSLVEQRPTHVPLTQACDALDLNRSSVYERRRPRAPTSGPRRQGVQPRALSAEQRHEVLQTLHSEPFQDQPPAQVYQNLLEQDQYLCSISTMHRLLREAGENGERRHQRPAQSHAVPRLAAKAPNQVWTWDISKLATSVRGHYLNLYVILDLYSRFVVAWMVSTRIHGTPERHPAFMVESRFLRVLPAVFHETGLSSSKMLIQPARRSWNSELLEGPVSSHPGIRARADRLG